MLRFPWSQVTKLRAGVPSSEEHLEDQRMCAEDPDVRVDLPRNYRQRRLKMTPTTVLAKFSFEPLGQPHHHHHHRNNNNSHINSTNNSNNSVNNNNNNSVNNSNNSNNNRTIGNEYDPVDTDMDEEEERRTSLARQA